MKKTKVLKREIKEVKKQEYYTIKNKFGNIEKITIPSNLQVGLDNDEFKSTISGSIHHTRQGKSYLVAGSGVTVVSSSNGQVTISASGGGEGSDAETVNLTASSTIIQYDSDGANPSPSSITLTATSKNFTNAFFKFTGGGGSFTDETSYTDGTGANSDTATFSVPSSFSSTPYDFRVGVAEAGQSELVFDTLSIGSTRVGATGTSGSDGSDGAAGVSKTVKLTASHTIIQYDADGLNPSPSSITLTATSKNFTNGFFKFTGDSFSDEGSFGDGNGGANSDTATFTSPSSFGSTPYTLRVGVAEGDQSEVDFDTISIGSTRTGATGNTGNTGATGPSTPDAAFTRSVIPVDTDDTGGALDDGNDLSDADISQQAFTKIDVNVGATNVTFAGHNASGNPSNNNYKIVSANVTAVTDNGTSLTVATVNNSGEGDSDYSLTCSNSGTRLKLKVDSDSSDAKLRVSFLAEHEDGSSTDFNSVLVSVPIKITTAAGTQTITRSFTVQKIKKGTAGTNGSDGADGADGSTDLAVYKVDTSSSLVNLTGHGGTGVMGAEAIVLFDTAVIADSDAVTSLSGGDFRVGGTGSYLITVNILGTTSGGDGSAVGEYEMKLRTSTDGFSSNNVEVAALSPISLAQGKASLFTFSGIYLATSTVGQSLRVTMNRVGNSGGANDQQILNVNQNDSAIIQITKIA